jgi:hypothetical protein
MKTILLPLALSLFTLAGHGCATRPVLSGITVAPLDSERRVFQIVNRSSENLHDVKISAWVGVASRWEGVPNFRIGDLGAQHSYFTKDIGFPLQALEIDGKCREGKFRAVWYSGDPLPELRSNFRFPF